MRELFRAMADWFGGSHHSDSSQRWRRRSLQHCSQLYGGVKAQVVDPLARGRVFRLTEEWEGPQTSASLGSFSSSRSACSRLPRRRKRKSVAVMTLKVTTDLIKGWTLRGSMSRRGRRRSFMAPGFLEDGALDSPEDAEISFYTRDGLPDDLSSYADEVFETPSEAELQQHEEEPELTGGALDRSELERSHLMLPLERGWRKVRGGPLVSPGLMQQQQQQQPQQQQQQQQRGQRIGVPVRKLFAREKRPYGLGIVGRLTNRSYRKRINSSVQRQMEDMDDHRPFFSYWITFVHLLVTVLSVTIYGIAPVGFSQQESIDSVLRNKGVYENVKFVQQENFWVGPSSEALIHLGAKFSPCMRQDKEVQQLIQEKRARERGSGCCVRNDRSGCLQTLQDECSVRHASASSTHRDTQSAFEALRSANQLLLEVPKTRLKTRGDQAQDQAQDQRGQSPRPGSRPEGTEPKTRLKTREDRAQDQAQDQRGQSPRPGSRPEGTEPSWLQPPDSGIASPSILEQPRV